MSADRQDASWSTDLACPGCTYNLRGLGNAPGAAGFVVDCPECGLRSDLAELATRRWDKPWFKAPGLTGLAWPVAWMFIGGIFTLFAAALMIGWLGVFGLLAFLLTGWAGLLAWVWTKYDGLVGVLFSLVLHVALAGYIASVPVIISGVLLLAWSGSFVGALAVVTAGVGMLFGARYLEKMSASFCIRRYLMRQPPA